MSKMKLLDSDDDEDAEKTTNSLEINKNYAERYENWRRLEELQKIKDKYGDNLDDTSSSDDEPEWSAADEMQFLKTLSALKDNDSAIYDGASSFWQSNGEEASHSEKPKTKDRKVKPMYLKDYERKLILEKGGQIDESDDDDDPKDPNYFEQQEQIRKELRRVVESNEGNGDSDESDELLVPKVKTKEEKEAEDNDFYSWMKSQDAKDISEDDCLKGLKKAWKDPNIDDGEKFLRDYILNKDFIPDAEDKGVTLDDIQEIEEDEKLLDMQRNFEQKYNFRFEDPDQEFIKQYPRTVGDSLRQSNTKRKVKREEYKERKEREKNERKQEIRELKKMKKAEIEKKLERLKKMAGDDIPISVDDLTGDFDPREYDKRMKQIFNEEYYGKDDSACDQDAEKPVFSDVDSEVESDSSDYDKFSIATVSEDVSSEKNDEETENKSDEPTRSSEKKSRRKMKRNSKFREAVRRKKPLFDPKEKTFEEYFNEYYALDYEDIIGDHLTRFKYRQVVPNDFGLSVGEILSADDRQLNAWASLKKATGYRSEHEEIVDLNRYKKKAADLKKKQRIFTTDFGGKKAKKMESKPAESEVLSSSVDKEKKKKKKKRHGNPATSEEKAETSLPQGNENGITESNNEQEKKKKKRKRKRNVHNHNSTPEVQTSEETPVAKKAKMKSSSKSEKMRTAEQIRIDDSRLRAYGLNPKKFKNKLKFGKKKAENSS